MRSLATAVAVVLFATASFAAPILVQPSAPDTHSFVTVTLGGGWPDSCGPAGTSVTMAGSNTVVIIVEPALKIETACSPVLSPWRQTVNLGVLPAGTYMIRAFYQASGGRLRDLAVAQFVVRSADSFRVVPPGAPMTGGTDVRLVSQAFWPTNQVVFGDGPPVSGTAVGHVLYVTAPPHAAGTVDIHVGPLTASHAFTFYDPAAPPDPSVFEPVLFPIAVNGSGAYGSSWVTENAISVPPSEPAMFFEMPPVTKLYALTANATAGIFLHAGRGTIDSAAMGSRIREVLHRADPGGVGMPVVRERDWRLDSVRLTNIPSDASARLTLRIWVVHDTPVPLTVEASVNGRQQWATAEVPVMRQDNGLLYAQLDITELVGRIPSTDPRDVTVASTGFDPDVRLWALATVTNNDTQQVTAIWPQ